MRLSRTVATFVALFSVLAILLMATAPGSAHERTVPPGFEQIDAWLADEVEDSRVPAAAVAVVRDGELAYSQGFGSDDGFGVTARTAFPIGSLTKSFTALAVMQLVDAGAIDLDAPLRTYIPWFTIADPDATAQITPRMLLNQTSGFSRDDGVKSVVEQWGDTSEEYVRGLVDVKLNRPVGTTYEYSNVNYAVLGLLIETVSGQTYADYVREHIFEPLGMRDSFVSLTAGREAGMVDLHHYFFGVPLETDTPDLAGQQSTGFIVSTAEDMARYISMVLNGGELDGARVVSSQGMATLLQPATNDFEANLLGETFDARYGMGWFAGEFGAWPDARWHLGQLPMFNAWMALDQQSGQALVVLVNANSTLPLPGAMDTFSRLPTGLAAMLEGQPAPEGTSVARFYLIFDVAVVVILALQVAALVRLARRPRPAPVGAGIVRRALVAVPFLWEFGLSLLILLGMPAAAGMDWRSVFTSMPDLALVVIAVALLWLATGATRAVKLLRRRARRSPAPAGEPAPRYATGTAAG